MKIFCYDGREMTTYSLIKNFVRNGHEVFTNYEPENLTGSTLLNSGFATLDKDTLCLVSDCSVIESSGIVDLLAKLGFTVFGNKFEQVYSFSRVRRILKEYGCLVPTYKVFSVYNKELALSFVDTSGIKKFVFRPNTYSDDVNYANTISFGLNADEIKVVIENSDTDFVIEEYIDGVPITLSGFFANGKFIPFISTFRYNYTYNINLGWLSDDSIGSISLYDITQKHVELFKPLFPYLSKIKFAGIISIDVICSNGKYYIVNMETGLRFPECLTYDYFIDGDIAKFFRNLITDGDLGISVRSDYVVSCCSLFVCGYPYSIIFQQFVKVKFPESVFNNSSMFVPMNVSKVDNEYFLDYSPTAPMVGVAVSSGLYLKESIDKMYSIAKEVDFYNKAYVTDIGKDVKKNLDILLKYELITKNGYNILLG